jgi:hypothetical protein
MWKLCVFQVVLQLFKLYYCIFQWYYTPHVYSRICLCDSFVVCKFKCFTLITSNMLTFINMLLHLWRKVSVVYTGSTFYHRTACCRADGITAAQRSTILPALQSSVWQKIPSVVTRSIWYNSSGCSSVLVTIFPLNEVLYYFSEISFSLSITTVVPRLLRHHHHHYYGHYYYHYHVHCSCWC